MKLNNWMLTTALAGALCTAGLAMAQTPATTQAPAPTGKSATKMNAVKTAPAPTAQEITDANAALFDAANGFHGCIAGIHEILRRQGLLAGRWCLDPDEDLSPGQMEGIDRVCREYPHLNDDAFVGEHLDEWLR